MKWSLNVSDSGVSQAWLTYLTLPIILRFFKQCFGYCIFPSSGVEAPTILEVVNVQLFSGAPLRRVHYAG